MQGHGGFPSEVWSTATISDENRKRAAEGAGISLRLRITLTFLVAGALLSALLSFTVYRIIDASLVGQARARVLELARLAAGAVNEQALARLEAVVLRGPGLVPAVESMADYRSLAGALDRVRSGDPRLVRSIFLFAPSADLRAGTFLISPSASRAGATFDLSDFPLARRAIVEKSACADERWADDPSAPGRVIRGWAPVQGQQGALLAAVGVEMADSEARLVLSNSVAVIFVVNAVVLALTLVVSLVLGTAFTRGIVSLERAVRSFDSTGMHARACTAGNEVGRLALSFNDMADTVQRYHDRAEALLGAYGRFVPHEFLRLLGKKSILDVKLGDQTEKLMSILFSDIVSFTSLSEIMTPFENFNFLNSYLRRMGPQISSRGGFIDKYIGDGIMALFPRSPDDALRAAIGMQTTLVEYNGHRHNSGYRPIAIGVGVHAGTLMLGTLGDDRRMDGSVISDAVNLCSRLQGLTRIYGSAVLTTGQTLKMLENPGSFHCRFIDRVHVRGRKEMVLLFEVLDGEPEREREKKLACRTELASALKMYFAREFSGALEIITRLLEKNPADEILRIYRRRCDLLVNIGAPVGWEGVQEIDTH